MLHITSFGAQAGGKTILKNINLTFEAGSVSALLGPNGSGKSTLASVLFGHPNFSLSPKSRIVFEEEDITKLSPDKRAKRGLFLSFQSPLPLPGINIFQLMRYAIDKQGSALAIRKRINTLAEELHINPDLLSRSLNDDFSGGEKKKMEVLQWAILEPKLAVFDEVDTGVDVDAIKTIVRFLKKHRSPKQSFIFITHSSALLQALPPNKTIVLKNGAVEREGDGPLALQIIEREGFEKVAKKK